MRPERWSCPSWPVPASGSRISLLHQGTNLLFRGLRRQAAAGVCRHGPGHVLHCLFEPEIVACRIDLGMGHSGPGFGCGLARLQALGLRVAAQPLDCRPHRLPAHQAGGRVRRRFHHVGAPKHRLLACEMGRKIVQPVRQITYRLSRNIHLIPLEPMAVFSRYKDRRLPIRPVWSRRVPIAQSEDPGISSVRREQERGTQDVFSPAAASWSVWAEQRAKEGIPPG